MITYNLSCPHPLCHVAFRSAQRAVMATDLEHWHQVWHLYSGQLCDPMRHTMWVMRRIIVHNNPAR